MKGYTGIVPELGLTVMAEGMLVSVRFKGGVFRTEDPSIQAGIEQHPIFGRQIFAVGEPREKVVSKAPEVKGGSEEERPGKAHKTRRRTKKDGAKKAKEQAAISAFMEEKVDA